MAQNRIDPRQMAAAPLPTVEPTTATNALGIPSTISAFVLPTFQAFEPATGKEFAPKEGGTAARCAVARCGIAGWNIRVSIYRHALASGKVRYYASIPRTGSGVNSAPALTVEKRHEAEVSDWLDNLAADCYRWRKASADHIAPPVSTQNVRGVEFAD